MARKASPLSPLHQEFGDRVRARRLELELSQEALAHESGLARAYIGQIEAGQRNVALDNLARIARALGVGLGELLDGLERLKGQK
jgi:transcriptional regulator with XRE-family HTH domain